MSKKKPTKQGTPAEIATVSPFYWVDLNKIRIEGREFTLKGHPYEVDWLNCRATKQCFKKGAQMGCTAIGVLRVIHGLIHGRYPVGYLYLFPSRDDVNDFSKARFQPLINENNCIREYVRDTDAANIKRVGKAMLYLRGARSNLRIGGIKKSSSQLKSISVDGVTYDERDEMTSDMVQLARYRYSHSEVQEEMYYSTPSIPDYGIDKLYEDSDQRIWVIRCLKCRGETCLEIEFPNCLIELPDGTVKKVCRKCGVELNIANGTWVSRYPSRKFVGWWISQLNSIYVDPKDILESYLDPPDGNLGEVYNSMLGMAYIAAENRLSPNDLWSRCGTDPMKVKHVGPSAMGVDVGKVLHVVIADKPASGTMRIVYTGRVGKFADVHDLARKFNVKSAVIDLEPETRKVREFQAAEPYPLYLCDYIHSVRGVPDWNNKDKLIQCNRTEICDATHELVIQPGKLQLPRRNEELDRFISEMCSMAKVRDEDDLGNVKYTYRKLGADHYRHATNYCLLAWANIGLSEETRGKFVLPWIRRSFMTK